MDKPNDQIDSIRKRHYRLGPSTCFGWISPEVASMMNQAIHDQDVLLAHIDELKRSFDLRWNADKRAIKMWQDAAPGRESTWPDHADLCVFLLELLEKTKTNKPNEDLFSADGYWLICKRKNFVLDARTPENATEAAKIFNDAIKEPND